MGRLSAAMACLAALAGCATLHPERQRPTTPVPWEQRLEALQNAREWRLEGRAAAAWGRQGWQASLDWRQTGAESELHLAGPFGVGALVIKLTTAGLSLDGAPPSDAMAAQLQERLGFELPLEHLRYWLLGVPDPGTAFELARNAQDRAAHLSQAGWSIDYAEYMPDDGLPKRLVMSRADARVRVAVEHWGTLK